MPSRRSTRDSGPRTKYTEDPFASAGLLSDASDEDKSPSGKRKGKAKMDAVGPEDISASDEEFAASQDDDEEDEDFADEDDIASEEEAASPGIEMGEPREKPTPIRRNAKRREKLKKESGHRRKAMEDENYVHSRGMYNPVSNTGKDLSLQVNFGGDERDHLGAAYMRDRWQRGYDSTFPSRHSLNQAESFADYGFGTTFGADPEDVRRERTQGWDWYYDADVGQRFRKRQRLEKIGEDDARRIYMPASKGKHTVLVGPADEQKVVELGKDEVFNFGGAWGERKPGPKGTKAAKGEPGPTGNSRSTGSSKLREGWIINFGQKVQAMGWAPNQPGLTQYLAVVAPITKEQKAHYPDPLEGKVSPAFRPSAPYPNAVQIWSFKAKKDESLTKTLDMNSRPRLRLALCTEWGELRRFSWCPMPRDAREEDDEDVLKNIGLLAGVWTDGAVRVIDVKIPRSGDDTEFHKVNSPAFEAKPPSTVCTCVTWLSPSDIAVGCTNGSVAIWNIARPQPFPYFYFQIHPTYVLSLASAYPSYPHIIATTAMDGEARLSSILDPQTDVVQTGRMRIAPPHISFSPLLQSFVANEESDSMRLLTTRRFFSSTIGAKIPGTVSALAPSSTCHPHVLMGGTAGAVVAMNPMRRLFSGRIKQYQQTWFTHEWVPPKDDGTGSGTSRFFDGFEVERGGLLRKAGDYRDLISGHFAVTIFEEGTHITSLAWNPNQCCAGWASAGMGCGLVRVEDVAL